MLFRRIGFAKTQGSVQSRFVTQPLALVFYQQLMPGSVLCNKLLDLGYRVEAVHELSDLDAKAQGSGPMMVLVDLTGAADKVSGALSRLKREPATQHLPLLAFGGSESEQAAALASGARLAVGERALLEHLPGLLEELLRVD